MQILSAADAILPALARTKLLLYSPFRAGRTWKLSATAYLSFAGTIFLPFTFIYGLAGLAIPELSGIIRALIVGASVFVTIVYTVVFWLCGRLNFAFFDMVLNREEFVAPAWRKYGEPSRHWTLVKMAIGSIFILILAGPAYVVFRHVILSLPALNTHMDALPPGPGLPPEMINFMMAFYGIYFLATLIVGMYVLVLSTVSSFVVPSMALEGSSVRVAFERFLSFAKREPGQLFAFVSVRFGLALAGYFGLIFAYEIVLFLLLFLAVLIFGAAGLLLHFLGVPTPVLLVLGGIVGVLFLVFVQIYVLVLALGPFFTFFEAHTLYFLGGRYPLLGELLERSTPPPMPPPSLCGRKL